MSRNVGVVYSCSNDRNKNGYSYCYTSQRLWCMHYGMQTFQKLTLEAWLEPWSSPAVIACFRVRRDAPPNYKQLIEWYKVLALLSLRGRASHSKKVRLVFGRLEWTPKKKVLSLNIGPRSVRMQDEDKYAYIPGSDLSTVLQDDLVT